MGLAAFESDEQRSCRFFAGHRLIMRIESTASSTTITNRFPVIMKVFMFGYLVGVQEFFQTESRW